MPGGFPGMMGPVFPLEVLQSPGQVTIIAEAFAQVRRIYLNEKQIAVEDAEPLFWGHSVGHWEGNTLVVNTIGLKENVRMSGVPHSPNMRIDERITVTSADTFEDQITVTDPEYLTGALDLDVQVQPPQGLQDQRVRLRGQPPVPGSGNGPAEIAARRIGPIGQVRVRARTSGRLDGSLRRLATVVDLPDIDRRAV